MGCFLACFGFQKRRRKRRSPADGVTLGEQISLSYEPLDSSPNTACDTSSKNPEIQNSKPRDRSKEQPWVKIRKKVSFNLNIQTYEPVPDDHYFLESDDEVRTGERCQEATPRIDSTSLSEEAFTTLNSGSYPQNYRYQNCGDSYDEDEDEDAYGKSDLDDSETDEDRDESNDEFKSCESETNAAIDRSQEVHSVLKPVENITQWRTAKAKATTITQQQMENKIKTSEQPQSQVSFSSNPSLTPFKSRSNSCLPDTQMQENLVHTSLTDWLV